MKLKKCIFIIICILVISIGFNLHAQQMRVKSFSQLMEPMTVEMQRKDNNGNICALVKVIIPSAQATFEGSLIGPSDFKTSEYWCYLTPGSKHLKIKYPNCEPLMVVFEDLIGSGVQSKQIYELSLSVPTFSKQNGRPLSVEIGFEKHGWLFSKEQQWRAVSDTIEPVTIYVNYKDGNYDEKTILNPQIHKEILLGNIVKGDKLTIVPDSHQYQALEYSVTENDLTNQKKQLGLRKKRMELSGLIIDEKTGLPIPDIKLEFFPCMDFSIDFSSNNKRIKTIDYNSSQVCISDSKGAFRCSDLLPGHTYDIRFGNLPIGYHSPNVPKEHSIFKTEPYNFKIECKHNSPYEFRISPNKLVGYIMDGNKPINGAIIKCKSLYNDSIRSDEHGYFEIFGYQKEDINIMADGYDTLRLYFDVNETFSYWESYWMAQPLKIKMKKTNAKTPRQREGLYNYGKSRVDYF